MQQSSLSNISSWYSGLQTREQLFILVAAFLSIILIFYYAIWSPLHNAIEENRTALNNEQALVSWLKEQASRAQLLQDRETVPSAAGSLTQIVNQTSRNTNIAISRMQPQGEELQVLIDAVPFNDLLQWLNKLEQRGVIIVQSDISSTNNSGIVQVRRLQLGKP